MFILNGAFSQFFAIFLLLNYCGTSICKNVAQVRIESGNIEGEIVESVSKSTSYYSFKGIPYAEPPLGDLKFKPPKPHNGWNGTLKALKHGNECVQLKDGSDDILGDEDCLYLNVYTPVLKRDIDSPLPVMFFIHGGHFRTGSGNSDFYGPDYFMDENVVLVTINYRLAVLGFLDLETEEMPGNMGLKDILLALKWVNKYIEEFGGDIKNIIIFGQGSGGVAVDILYLSPAAKGLFHKAILQSGTALVASYFDWKPRERAYTLATYLDASPSDDASLIKLLKETKPGVLQENLMRTLHPDETIFKQLGVLAFTPTLNNKTDETFITKLPEDLIEEKNIPDLNIPLMIGFNSQESIVDNWFYIQRPHFIKNLEKRFPFVLPLRGIYAEFDSNYHYEVQYRIKWFYFNVTVDITKETILDEYLNYMSDEHVIPIDQSARSYGKISKAPVYFYRFSYEGGLNYFKTKAVTPRHGGDPVVVDGASEKDELCYLFKCNVIKEYYEKMHSAGEESDDLKTVRRMVRLWTNFARTENPTPKGDEIIGDVEWDPVEEHWQNFLDVREYLHRGFNPHFKSVEFWQAMYDYYRPLATDGVLIDPEGSDETKEKDEL